MSSIYRNNPKCLDRYTCANNADPDQMLHNVTSDQSTLFATHPAIF